MKMKMTEERPLLIRIQYIIMMFILVMVVTSANLYGQEPPPRPLQVTLDQNLGFGAFTHGIVGGSVSVSTGGARTSTGDVILLGLGIPFTSASFRLVANPGTVVSILIGPDVQLLGSGGGSMTLHIDGTLPASPFVMITSPPAYTLLYVGGTLTVGNVASNPPGSYTGTFDLNFIQE
jgi:hypothetical protein